MDSQASETENAVNNMDIKMAEVEASIDYNKIFIKPATEGIAWDKFPTQNLTEDEIKLRKEEQEAEKKLLEKEEIERNILLAQMDVLKTQMKDMREKIETFTKSRKERNDMKKDIEQRLEKQKRKRNKGGGIKLNIYSNKTQKKIRKKGRKSQNKRKKRGRGSKKHKRRKHRNTRKKALKIEH